MENDRKKEPLDIIPNVFNYDPNTVSSIFVDEMWDASLKLVESADLLRSSDSQSGVLRSVRLNRALFFLRLAQLYSRSMNTGYYLVVRCPGLLELIHSCSLEISLSQSTKNLLSLDNPFILTESFADQWRVRVSNLCHGVPPLGLHEIMFLSVPLLMNTRFIISQENASFLVSSEETLLAPIEMRRHKNIAYCVINVPVLDEISKKKSNSSLFISQEKPPHGRMEASFDTLSSRIYHFEQRTMDKRCSVASHVSAIAALVESLSESFDLVCDERGNKRYAECFR